MHVPLSGYDDEIEAAIAHEVGARLLIENAFLNFHPSKSDGFVLPEKSLNLIKEILAQRGGQKLK